MIESTDKSIDGEVTKVSTSNDGGLTNVKGMLVADIMGEKSKKKGEIKSTIETGLRPKLHSKAQVEIQSQSANVDNLDDADIYTQEKSTVEENAVQSIVKEGFGGLAYVGAQTPVQTIRSVRLEEGAQPVATVEKDEPTVDKLPINDEQTIVLGPNANSYAGENNKVNMKTPDSVVLDTHKSISQAKNGTNDKLHSEQTALSSPLIAPFRHDVTNTSSTQVGEIQPQESEGPVNSSNTPKEQDSAAGEPLVKEPKDVPQSQQTSHSSSSVVPSSFTVKHTNTSHVDEIDLHVKKGHHMSGSPLASNESSSVLRLSQQDSKTNFPVVAERELFEHDQRNGVMDLQLPVQPPPHPDSSVDTKEGGESMLVEAKQNNHDATHIPTSSQRNSLITLEDASLRIQSEPLAQVPEQTQLQSQLSVNADSIVQPAREGTHVNGKQQAAVFDMFETSSMQSDSLSGHALQVCNSHGVNSSAGSVDKRGSVISSQIPVLSPKQQVSHPSPCAKTMLQSDSRTEGDEVDKLSATSREFDFRDDMVNKPNTTSQEPDLPKRDSDMVDKTSTTSQELELPKRDCDDTVDKPCTTSQELDLPRTDSDAIFGKPRTISQEPDLPTTYIDDMVNKPSTTSQARDLPKTDSDDMVDKPSTASQEPDLPKTDSDNMVDKSRTTLQEPDSPNPDIVSGMREESLDEVSGEGKRQNAVDVLGDKFTDEGSKHTTQENTPGYTCSPTSHLDVERKKVSVPTLEHEPQSVKLGKVEEQTQVLVHGKTNGLDANRGFLKDKVGACGENDPTPISSIAPTSPLTLLHAAIPTPILVDKSVEKVSTETMNLSALLLAQVEKKQKEQKIPNSVDDQTPNEKTDQMSDLVQAHNESTSENKRKTPDVEPGCPAKRSRSLGVNEDVDVRTPERAPADASAYSNDHKHLHDGSLTASMSTGANDTQPRIPSQQPQNINGAVSARTRVVSAQDIPRYFDKRRGHPTLSQIGKTPSAPGYAGIGVGHSQGNVHGYSPAYPIAHEGPQSTPTHMNTLTRGNHSYPNHPPACILNGYRGPPAPTSLHLQNPQLQSQLAEQPQAQSPAHLLVRAPAQLHQQPHQQSHLQPFSRQVLDGGTGLANHAMYIPGSAHSLHGTRYVQSDTASPRSSAIEDVDVDVDLDESEVDATTENDEEETPLKPPTPKSPPTVIDDSNMTLKEYLSAFDKRNRAAVILERERMSDRNSGREISKEIPRHRHPKRTADTLNRLADHNFDVLEDRVLQPVAFSTTTSSLLYKKGRRGWPRYDVQTSTKFTDMPSPRLNRIASNFTNHIHNITTTHPTAYVYRVKPPHALSSERLTVPGCSEEVPKAIDILRGLITNMSNVRMNERYKNTTMGVVEAEDGTTYNTKYAKMTALHMNAVEPPPIRTKKNTSGLSNSTTIRDNTRRVSTHGLHATETPKGVPRAVPKVAYGKIGRPRKTASISKKKKPPVVIQLDECGNVKRGRGRPRKYPQQDMERHPPVPHQPSVTPSFTPLHMSKPTLTPTLAPTTSSLASINVTQSLQSTQPLLSPSPSVSPKPSTRSPRSNTKSIGESDDIDTFSPVKPTRPRVPRPYIEGNYTGRDASEPLPPPIPMQLSTAGDASGVGQCRKHVSRAQSTPPPPICGFCLGDESKNKNGEAEELLGCSQCPNKGHPSCLQLDDALAQRTKTYPWLCMDCKACEQCKRKDSEDYLLFCDGCDRAYHMFCLKPKLHEAPEGDWFCPHCKHLRKAAKRKSSYLQPSDTRACNDYSKQDHHSREIIRSSNEQASPSQPSLIAHINYPPSGPFQTHMQSGKPIQRTISTEIPTTSAIVSGVGSTVSIHTSIGVSGSPTTSTKPTTAPDGHEHQHGI
eukprot:CFRG8272T1